MADSKVVFETDLDESGLNRALKGLGKTVGTWAKGSAVAVGAVGTALAGLAKKAFEYNAQMESYQTNFAVLLGDEAKALQHVTSLREIAAKTPFGMEDLASASQTMLSFGLSAEASMEAMQQLGDIALGNKDKFSRLALVFSQISAAGKLTGEDLNQMIDTGFNPLNTIAEKTGANLGDLKEVMAGGKGSKEFQKQMKAAQAEVKKLGESASEGAKLLAQIGTDGMISAEMVGRAIEMETSPGGKFYNGMAKAAETVQGLLSTLSDDADALIGEVFAPLTEEVGKTIVPLAQNYLQQLQTAFTSGGNEGLISAIGDVLGDMATQAASVLPDATNIAVGILQNIASGLSANSDEIASGLTSAISALATSELPATLVSSLGTLAASLVSSIATSLPETLPDVATAIVNSVSAAFKTTPEFAGAADSFLSGLKEGLVGKDGSSGAVAVLANGIIDGINAILAASFPKIQGLELPPWSEIQEKVNAWWDEIKTKIESLLVVILGLEIPQPGEEWSIDTPEGRAPYAYYTSSNYGEKPKGWLANVWNSIFGISDAGAETYAAAAAGGIKTQLNAELRKAFADGDPQVQAALMAGLTPTDNGSGITQTQTLADQIGTELAEGLAAQGEKLKAAMSELVSTALDSFEEIQAAGDALAQNVWEPIIKADDQASVVIQNVKNALAALDGSSATVHINATDGVDGSHANGLDYVPYDNYLALLHKGERVLTAEEAADYVTRSASRDLLTYQSIKSLDLDRAIKSAIENATFIQNNTFNQPVQTPDEFADMLRMYATYGLAGE